MLLFSTAQSDWLESTGLHSVPSNWGRIPRSQNYIQSNWVGRVPLHCPRSRGCPSIYLTPQWILMDSLSALIPWCVINHHRKCVFWGRWRRERNDTYHCCLLISGTSFCCNKVTSESQVLAMKFRYKSQVKAFKSQVKSQVKTIEFQVLNKCITCLSAGARCQPRLSFCSRNAIGVIWSKSVEHERLIRCKLCAKLFFIFEIRRIPSHSTCEGWSPSEFTSHWC